MSAATRSPALADHIVAAIRDVVGAGPAGLAATAEAAAAGSSVVVLERAERLGGQLGLTGLGPGTAEIGKRLVEQFVERLAESEVDLRLGTDADVGSVLALVPDAVIVATGARPFQPDLPLAGVDVVR